MSKPVEIPDPKAIRTEEDALDQSIALNKIVLSLLQQQKDSNKRLFIALVLSILANLCITAGFLYYESQWKYETSTVTTITQEADGDSNINNVQGDQYNDNAVHNSGGAD